MGRGSTTELDVARRKLAPIEHIVVLQLENRSFDHVFGYLGLPQHALPDHGDGLDANVNGLGAGQSNSFGGNTFAPEPLDETAFDGQHLDPPHDAPEVTTQIAGGAMSGFVEAWSGKLTKKKSPYATLPATLKAVMGYMTPDRLPVFDHLARNFCLCDNWFCSVPGPTMPNRFFSVAGTTQNTMSNFKLLVLKSGRFKSFFRHLEADAWRWYSSDPGILRAIDKEYRLDVDEHDHFAYFDQRTDVQPRTFLRDVLEEPALPSVAWIDPNFAIADMLPLGDLLDTPGSNDDHPPSKVIEGQKLVHKVYEALRTSERYRDSFLLIVFYDEHGGFHDHQAPPPDHGPRIPALLIGPHVKRGVCHEQFDHASVIKTILLRFGQPGSIEAMPERVGQANDLSVTLRDDGTRAPLPPVVAPGEAALGPDALRTTELGQGASTAVRAIDFLDRELTDLQRDLVQHIAIPLRTGFQSLRAVRSKRLMKLLLGVVARFRKYRKRLPPRHP